MLEKQHNNKNKSSVELKAFYAAAEAEVGAVAQTDQKCQNLVFISFFCCFFSP
jgi:hypothetical protein